MKLYKIRNLEEKVIFDFFQAKEKCKICSFSTVVVMVLFGMLMVRIAG